MYKYSLILTITALCALPNKAHCSISGQPLVNHLRVIREFKQLLAKKRAPLRTTAQKPVRTQTEAYLAQPELKRNIESTWRTKLSQHKTLIDNILAREKEYAPTHYVFYHGQQGNLRILQDITKELFMLFNLPEHACDNFIFLRAWTKGSTQADVTAFIDAANKDHPYGWGNYTFCNGGGHTDSFKNYLLSVNLALFGNHSMRKASECTFNFFIKNTSCYVGGIHDILGTLLHSLGLTTKEAMTDNYWNPTHGLSSEQLIKINNILQQFTSGQLLQIFIPKEDVDRYVYRAVAGGAPFGYTQKYEPESYTYRTIYSNEYILSPALENYLHNRMDSTEMDTLQARILITPAILDPANDIHIHRYQLSFNSKQEAIYEQELKQIVHELVTQAYETGRLNIPSGCNTQRLLRYIQDTPRY